MQLVRKRFWFKTEPRPCHRYTLEAARLDWMFATPGSYSLGKSKRTAIDPVALPAAQKAAYRAILRKNARTVHDKRRAAERRAAVAAQADEMHAAAVAEYGPEGARLLSTITSLDMANFHTPHNRADRAALARQLEAL
jgi:hypothetical protein